MRATILKWSLVLLGILLALFFWNGVNPRWKHPEMGTIAKLLGTPAPGSPTAQADECSVLALNLAKLGFHRGGFDFAEDFEVRQRLEQAADLIRASGADVVCLSEVVFDGGPSGVRQVQELAEASGLAHWGYADNYRFGLPFYQIRAGNAILSRYPLEPAAVLELPGSAPFWNPTGRRRMLMCEAKIGVQQVRIGSVRNDSSDLDNNLRQAKAILEGLNSEQVLLAGNFSAQPGDTSMHVLKNSGLFSGNFEGPASLPSEERRLDYVLAPRTWRLLEETLIETTLSDHLAVLARFRLPAR